MDKAAAQAAAIEGARVDSIRDANNLKALKVTFDSGILFATGKSTLNTASKDALTKFSKILVANPTMDITILGHTDNVGSLETNQKLSQGRAQAVATGVKRALPEKIVFTYQGDGDIAAIGTAHAIHVAARGEKITTIMVNNAVFGMTGGQMAPTTLDGQVTTTSPYGRDTNLAGAPIDLPKTIATLNGAVYVASVSVDSPKNIRLAKKAIKKAFQVQQQGLGFALVSVLSTCPTNWGMSPVESLKWLQEKMLPIYQMGELKVSEEVAKL